MTTEHTTPAPGVQLAYDATTGIGSVVIDGVDLSQAASAVTLHLDADAVPRLVIDLCAVNVSAVAGQVDLWLTDDARALLERAGWTPPPGGGQ